MWFWFRMTVLPIVIGSSVIYFQSTAAPRQRSESLPPKSANLMLLESVYSAVGGADGSILPLFARFPQWYHPCSSSVHNREHQTLLGNSTPTQHPRWFYTSLLRLCWSQHNEQPHAPAYSNFCLCKQSDLSAWYSRSLGAHICLLTLSGETSLLHYQHTAYSLFSPPFYFLVYLTYIL